MLNPTIGLEIHAQLKTKHKLFSQSLNLFGENANSLINEFDIALPGTLPVLNKEAVRLAIAFGFATQSKINLSSFFDRKHYFYPDSPSGFQITQSTSPIVMGGEVNAVVDGITKNFKIHHTHLETDAGKTIHSNGISLVDYNRVGTPLIEIVSEPCMKSIDDALAYAKAIYEIVCYHDICDGNMQEGSFRIDANISLSNNATLGTRCEIKNLNSFRFLKEALQFEIERQTEILESGGKIIQQTRLFDSHIGKTEAMRDKENAEDYRYFPEPDLLPIILKKEDIDSIEANMRMSIESVKEQLTFLGLKKEVINNLISEKDLLEYAFSFMNDEGFNPDWFRTIVFFLPEIFSRNNIKFYPLEKEKVLAILIAKNNGLSSSYIKSFFEKIILKVDFDLELEIKSQTQISETLNLTIEEIITSYSKEVLEYKSGKTKVLGFLVGQVMKKEKANPEQVKKILNEKIGV